MFDVVILTDHRYVNPKKTDWYVEQVLLEDQLLLDALKQKGLKVCKKDWADKTFDWTTTKYAIFRTTWDYFERFNEFFTWLENTKNKTTFINSSDIINWNIDKNYLQDLAKNKINIAPTLFVKEGDTITLNQLFEKTNWTEAVLKPAVSGAARHTYRTTPSNCSEIEAIFQKLIKNEGMLFQEFLNNITTQGEISLIMIGGRYTHAIKKIAKEGDFRVQDDHGGRIEKYTPTKEEIVFAENCLAASPFKPMYARVDIVYDNNNKPSLSELELIEPELWFRNHPKAAEQLAEKISKLSF
ncbi:MAG: hypothetical protein H8E84_08840 [Flavobacteriales bacterium]|nr:hypothetical protein [Flavobacteriales bacterium]